MKNPFITLSSLVDKTKEKRERQAEEQAESVEKQEKSIEIEITRQFEAAKEIVGHRLTMEKQHGRMYYFLFKGITRTHVAYIHLKSYYAQSNCDFCIQGSSYYGDNLEATSRLQESFHLSDLKDRIVDWCTLIIKVFYSEKEN